MPAVVFLLILASLGGNARQLAPTPWEAYLIHPTDQNARQVKEIAYSNRLPDKEEFERLDRDLSALEVDVLQAKPEAVLLAARLRVRADGHLTESLDIMLGDVIATAPLLVLTAVATASDRPERLDSLCCNLGEGSRDRTAFQQAAEIQSRISALRRVSDDGVKALRDACLVELLQCLEEDR